ncbi:neuronal acetylcholine receptor subunit alpha-10-like [Gigantopelta aegis]|uniref:neuronal acetylcholine receptor subunit alpha-10-like n=1 Tax=Gigantopelta aegis TaxID=1735272 RepID=UPI001B889396|nr:neuronal acetylcholine receptor subunit alpha-10-like [Gigantopelta aegis]XP_041363748.1 neuronal acetylcholine receptor subunit alpha-10-like [Gigantopelta aegis]
MDFVKGLVIVACIVLANLVITDARRGRQVLSYEDQLVRKILNKYKMRGKYSRPVARFNDTLTVYFALQMTQIMDLDEQDQILTLNIWDQYVWQDNDVKWNKSEYGGVDKVRIPWNKIWLPDIKLHNYADYRLDEHRKVLCVFEHTGSILWMPQAVYRSSCPIDVTKFPFDVQNCTLKFGSWTYDGDQLDLKFLDNKNYIDLTAYVESNSWIIIDVPAIRNVKKYTCCPGTFIDLRYYLIFQRRATLYNYILILPCVLLTSITLVLFWIPPESPAKMQLGLIVFIAFFILLKILDKNLPPGTSTMPLLGTYYCLNMILITLSVFLNVLVVNLAAYGHRANLPAPAKQVLFDVCAKMLMMGDLVKPLQKNKSGNEPADSSSLEASAEQTTPSQDPKPSSEVPAPPSKEMLNQLGHLTAIDTKLCEIREFINILKGRIQAKDRRETLIKEWKAIGLILDRIFFVFYLLFIVSCLVVILPMLTYTKVPENSMLQIAKGG